MHFQKMCTKTDPQNVGPGRPQGEFPEVGPVSVPSCPRGLGIFLDPHLFSFWLVPGASGMAQEESPSIRGRGRWKPWGKGWTNIFPKKLKTQRNLVKQQPPHVHRNLKLMDLRVRSAPPIINKDLRA